MFPLSTTLILETTRDRVFKDRLNFIFSTAVIKFSGKTTQSSEVHFSSKLQVTVHYCRVVKGGRVSTQLIASPHRQKSE